MIGILDKCWSVCRANTWTRGSTGVLLSVDIAAVRTNRTVINRQMGIEINELGHLAIMADAVQQCAVSN